MAKTDNSSQIIEDIKWFMYGDEQKPIKNEENFHHDTTFVAWSGDGHSFILKDVNNETYRVSVIKE